MDRRRACLPIPAGLPHHPQITRGQTLGRSAILDCPGGSTGTSRPVASLRAKGAPRRGRVPPMVYLDNPERRRETQPSDPTSANNNGFWLASTPMACYVSRATDKAWLCLIGLSLSLVAGLFVIEAIEPWLRRRLLTVVHPVLAWLAAAASRARHCHLNRHWPYSWKQTRLTA